MDESRKSGSGLALAVVLLGLIVGAMLGYGGLVAYRVCRRHYMTLAPQVFTHPPVLIEDPAGAAPEEPKGDGMSSDEPSETDESPKD